jgi:hypothetical protein
VVDTLRVDVHRVACSIDVCILGQESHRQPKMRI